MQSPITVGHPENLLKLAQLMSITGTTSSDEQKGASNGRSNRLQKSLAPAPFK